MTGSAKKHPLFNMVISNMPGPCDTLYLYGAQLDELYPVSIVTRYLALDITISGYGNTQGFGFVACRRLVPALQGLLDNIHASINEMGATLGIGLIGPVKRSAARKTAHQKK